VIKPASYTPAATYELVKLIQQAGLPKGVLSMVPGPGKSSAGDHRQQEGGQDLLHRRDGTGKMIGPRRAWK
jgi:acyl-CoA reductase-like NAD-dependent aldehyde dehydrogenase